MKTMRTNPDWSDC